MLHPMLNKLLSLVKLGIGYGNSKQFLKRLKMFGITYKELKRAVEDVK